MTATQTAMQAHHRKTSWGHLGTDVSNAQNLDEVLAQAGLDWDIEVREAANLTMLTDTGVISTSIPGKRLVMRKDNGVTLGVVGGRYQPINNYDAFGVADYAVQAGATYAYAGSMDHGRRAFVTLDIPEAEVRVGGIDLVRFSVVLRTTHDGRTLVESSVKGTRLVCTNGMTVNLAVPHEFGIAHTRNAMAKMADARTAVQGAMRYAKEFAAVADSMFDSPMTVGEFADYVDTLYPRPQEDGEKKSRAVTLWEKRRSDLLHLFRFAETNEIGRNTRWAAFNAVTEYLDWFAPTRGQGSDGDRRARRQVMKAEPQIKNRAMDLLRVG